MQIAQLQVRGQLDGSSCNLISGCAFLYVSDEAVEIVNHEDEG